MKSIGCRLLRLGCCCCCRCCCPKLNGSSRLRPNQIEEKNLLGSLLNLSKSWGRFYKSFLPGQKRRRVKQQNSPLLFYLHKVKRRLHPMVTRLAYNLKIVALISVFKRPFTHRKDYSNFNSISALRRRIEWIIMSPSGGPLT